MPPTPQTTPMAIAWRDGARAIFWLAFYGVGALGGLISLRSFGLTSGIAVFLQVACGLWLVTVLLHVLGSRSGYLTAAGWVLLLWVPLSFQVIRRLHQWISVGMDAADGMGSPMAFLLGFVLEWLIYAALCFMLLVLLLARPWRSGLAVNAA